MDITKLTESFKNCPCGKDHSFDMKAVEIGENMLENVGKILIFNGFPKKILLVSDKNCIALCDGIYDYLRESGFTVKSKIYDDLRYAYLETSDEIIDEAKDCDGILSVGSGSNNDVCRYAAARANKDFAIFATAPSMDGFASDTAPIIINRFKISMPAKQPSIIIGDTNILAYSPTELKAAGFGDMMGKYFAICDWKISNLLSGEYICDNIISLVENTLEKLVALADKVPGNDKTASAAIMEGLVLSGYSMKLAHSSRPASGAEHIVSHFWEIKKLDMGIFPDFHGKKVGLATCLLLPIYKEYAKRKSIKVKEDIFDIDDILSHYPKKVHKEVTDYNTPPITNLINRKFFEENWDKIKEYINDLPETEYIKNIMKKAGCKTEIEECHISPEFAAEAIKYSPYMRKRITFLRLLNMIE